MKRRFFALALCLVSAESAWSLDAKSEELAARYLSIVRSNLGQGTAFERLWKIYADAGETEKLVESCRQRSAEEPVLCARVLLRAGQRDAAREILRKAAAAGHVAAMEMLAGLLEEDGDFPAAAGLIEKAAAVQETPALLVRSGELWVRAGDILKSRAAWERAVALAPGDLSLRKQLAAAAGQAGDITAAVGHLRIIAEKGAPAERFAAWEEISRHLENAGKLEDAIAAQEALLALTGPGHWKLAAVRQRLVALHQRNGTLEVLEKKWREEAEARPRDAEFALRMAEFHKFQADDARRLFWLRQASELLPKDAALAGETAALELSTGHPEAAAALYERILVLRPQDEDVIFLRAEVSALSGQEEDAEKRIAEFLAARKGDENAAARAREFYRRLHLSVPLERELTARFSAARYDEVAATELVRFYLEKHRDKEAAAALERFDDSRLALKDTAAVALRFSELLRDAKMNDEALAWARKAFARDAAVPEYAMHLVDLLAAREEFAAARAVLDEACAASGTALPREDLDRRLFVALQTGEKESETLLPGSGEEVRKMIGTLQHQAATETSETSWLRLARWRGWNNDPAGAVTALREGLSKNPDSVVLRETLAAALGQGGEALAAIEELRKLTELQPEKSAEYQRRIGHLQLDSGHLEEGLATFEARADNLPKDWQAVADLAQAEQRAGNWFRALETWRRAHALAPVGSRRDLRPPILNATTRLQLYDQGLDFLEEACAAERDADARGELFREASSFALQNRVAEDWRSRLERRIKSAPGEVFWKMGLVFLLEEEGRGAEARQTLVESRQSAEETNEDIQTLLTAAEKAGDWNEAARLLKRLIASENSPNPASAMRYAECLERAGKIEEARQAWAAVVARHARTPAALIAAADFFERADDDAQMEACQRAAARLGDCPPQVNLRLGRLALERGDRMQALADFEAVLNGTRSDPALGKDCLPLPVRILEGKDKSMASVGFLPSGLRTHVRPPTPWRKADEIDPEGCRLLAIQEVARLLVNSPQKQKWLKGFSSPVERIWAAYYSGEPDAAYAEMEELMNLASATPAMEQAFAALALEDDQAARLARWASGNPEKSGPRWDNVLVALTRLLDAGWRPAADSAAGLFAPAPALQRWQAAQSFASRNFHLMACLVGESVPGDLSSSEAVSAWLKLSQWRVALRDPDGAILYLDRAIQFAPPAVSYANPLFAAIRARWLLTPPGQHEAFEKELSAHWQAQKHTASEAAGRALIAALREDDEAADRGLAALFGALGVSEEEGWASFIQQGGAQLEEWNLHRLARELYRQDLARDPVLAAMRGETFQRSTESLLVFNHIAGAGPRSAPYLVNEWAARGATDEELLQAATRLQQSGRPETAALVFQKLCARDSRNEAVCSGIINLAAVSSLRNPAIAYLGRFLAGDPSLPGRALTQNAAVRLSALLEEEGKFADSLAVLERFGGDRTLLMPRIQTLGRMGRFREALEVLEKRAALPASAGGGISLPLAELYTAFGRERDARAVLEKEARGSSSERLAALHILAGIPPSAKPPEPTPPDRSEPEKSLQALDHGALTQEERFQAGRRFLAAHRDIPDELRRGELLRLKKISSRNPALLPAYYVLRMDLAGSSGTTAALEKEMMVEWRAGRYLAGEILIRLFLEQKRFDDLGLVLDDFLTDRHFQERAWDQIGQSLLDAGQPAMAARVFSELTARMPGDSNRALFLAGALWKSGRQDEAQKIIAPLDRLAALDPQKHLDLAQFALSLQNVSEAKSHLLAADLPGNGRAADLWGAVAAECIKNKQFAEAREALVRATDTGNPVMPVQTMADYYAGDGTLTQLEPDANEFNLPSHQFRALQIELAGRLIAGGGTDRAWVWMENCPALLREARWRELLLTLEKSDWDRAARVWEIAAQNPSWEVRVAAAQFFLRHAQAVPVFAARDLARAHDLHPGSFAIASAYSSELLRLKKPAAARKVLQDVIAAYAQPDDRRAAQALLASLQVSPPLPNEG